MVMLKSLMPGCFFNIVGFGSTHKSLFPTSQTYDEVNPPLPIVTVLANICTNDQTIWRISSPLIRKL